MATKLKSISERIHWPLLARSLLLGFSWLLAPFWLFLVLALYFYFVPNFQSLRVIRSFAAFLVLSFLIPELSDTLSYFAALGVAFAFYLVLGIKDLILINRQSAHQVLRFILMLGSCTIFFWWGQVSGASFVWQWLLFFAGTYVISRELFEHILGEPSKKTRLVALLAAFVVFQVAWALTWLPIGFLNATAVMLLVIFMMDDFIIHHFKGDLDRKRILTGFTVFVFSLLIIFALSEWKIK